MRKKKIFISLVLLLSIGIYFAFFHQDKTLKYIPKNADFVVLVDVKQLTRESIASFVMNPSLWFNRSKDENALSVLKDSGIKIPDFVQIFHLENTNISDWYTVLELENPQEFLEFLKQQKFVTIGNDIFQKEQFFIKMIGEKCIVGNSKSSLNDLQAVFVVENSKNNRHANEFIQKTVASISAISSQKIQTFGVTLDEDEIVITNNSELQVFSSLLQNFETKNHFLDLELDAKNTKKFAQFFDKNNIDSAQINAVKAIANLEEVNDTIITYEYDDDFNEVEKKTFQKLVQPNYTISLATKNSEKTWEFFKNKKWISTENQFTAIPFQPNLVSLNKDEIAIVSTKKPVKLSKWMNENYIFLRNSKLLFSSYHHRNAFEKKLISNLDYIFYGNKDENYYVKIKFHKGNLPLILK